jgi:lipoprotein-releasing system permease protein
VRGRDLGLVLDVALAHLGRRKRQTLVSVTGVALGVGFFIGMAAMMQGFQRYFVSQLIDVQPHIVMKDEYRTAPRQPARLMFPGGAVEVRGVKPKDEVRGVRNAGLVTAAALAEPGLTAAEALSGQVILRYGSRDVAGTLVGIDPAAERLVTNLEKDLTAGRLESLHTSANGILLGDGLAQKLGIAMGETLNAISPAGVVMRMKVVGVFRTGITTVDNAYSYALLRKAQVLYQRPNVVNQVRFRLAEVERAAEVAARLESRFGYRTESWEESNKNVLGIFVIQNGIMYSSVGAILVVAAFGIFNIVSTVIHEKTRDIAILMSMGLEESDIQRIFVAEGFAVGLVGTVVGWGIGYFITWLLSLVRFDIEGFIRAQGFILYETPTHYLLGGAFAIVAATFAAWLPARKAARLDPVEIIRGAG